MFDRPTIFISAYRNFSVRYILYSNILNELLKSDLRIVLFFKDNDLEYYRKKFNHDNIILEPVLYGPAMKLLKKHKLGRLFVLVRYLMSGSSEDRKNTTSDVRSYQYSLEFSGSLLGKAVFSVVHMAALAGRRSSWFRRFFTGCEARLFAGHMYDEYFAKYNPSMLITSSLGYMIDPYFMRAAKRNNCPVLSILHSWDNPTTKGYRGADPDYIVAWNSIMKEEINTFHDIPADRIFVGGIAHWDAYFNGRFRPGTKEEFLEKYDFSRDRKTIMYGTSSPVNFQRTFDVIEQLLEEIDGGRLEFPAQLLIRLHPVYLTRDKGRTGQVVEEYREKIEKMESRFGKLVKFTVPQMSLINDDIDMPLEDMLEMARCLVHSDVLLTEYSTLMIEGAIFDTPVINVAMYNFRDTDKPASYVENYMHIKRALAPGAVRNAYEFDELTEYIREYLRDPSMDSEKRKALVEQEITHNRGFAGKAIAEHIRGLLGGQGAEDRGQRTEEI